MIINLSNQYLIFKKIENAALLDLESAKKNNDPKTVLDNIKLIQKNKDNNFIKNKLTIKDKQIIIKNI